MQYCSGFYDEARSSSTGSAFSFTSLLLCFCVCSFFASNFALTYRIHLLHNRTVIMESDKKLQLQTTKDEKKTIFGSRRAWIYGLLHFFHKNFQFHSEFSSKFVCTFMKLCVWALWLNLNATIFWMRMKKVKKTMSLSLSWWKRIQNGKKKSEWVKNIWALSFLCVSSCCFFCIFLFVGGLSLNCLVVADNYLNLHSLLLSLYMFIVFKHLKLAHLNTTFFFLIFVCFVYFLRMCEWKCEYGLNRYGLEVNNAEHLFSIFFNMKSSHQHK